ncbi:MAG: hypothetical protein II802_03040 [Clostridia bacterium]|nr:hypothetical protein [Clostridia bacterium]
MKNFIKFRKTVMLAIKVLIVAAITFGFIETWNSNYIDTLFSKNGNFVVIFSFVFIFVAFSSLYGAFNIGVSRLHETIYSFSLAAIITNFIMYMELSLIARQLVAVAPMVAGVFYQIVIIVVTSFCANTIYFKLYSARRMLAIFSDDETGFELIEKMSRISNRFRIECGVNAKTTPIEDIKKLIDKYEAVVICDIDKNIPKETFSYCYTT